MTDEELLREALGVLQNARCALHDVTLRVQWGQRKIRLMTHLRERLEQD